ncbi:E3 ubiquitin/ISG15 ligase TRIM25 isoform X2 [Coregonus clupeaformis]|uniref:E3 ubiquitin/ISG15 ligase TRIM25 isoform X2 n=1 Tax=Coregonus clupeaformis TaxID=59861 RepID=UPI001BDF92CB|nr:E3 ubiquitin/ISG15 ligase TRIM25 isoform X2 [Coregonus clupeaformis]
MARRQGKDGSLWKIQHHKCERHVIWQKQFLPYFTELKLNPDSSYNKLHLTEKNSVVTRMDKEQRKDDGPGRFTHIAQVTCAPLKRSAKDRYYWEVAWSGEEGVKIAVSYMGIQKFGLHDVCRFGRNPLSWSLECTKAGFSFWHNNVKKNIPVEYVSSRIGVFLDYEAGTLSFFDRPYLSCDTLKLLYKVETEFTEDLFPGFWLGLGSTVGMCRKEREHAAKHHHYTDYDDDSY